MPRLEMEWSPAAPLPVEAYAGEVLRCVAVLRNVVRGGEEGGGRGVGQGWPPSSKPPPHSAKEPALFCPYCTWVG